MPDQVTQVQPSGNSGGGGGFGPGLIIGIVVVILIIIGAALVWGIPGMNNTGTSPESGTDSGVEVPAPDSGAEIPSEIDVNVDTPQ
jgi:cell division protein YceG involved in septum cleavage